MIDRTTFDVIEHERAEVGVVADAPAIKVDDSAVLSEELLLKMKSGSQTWRDQMVEDWDFFLGAQVSDKADDTNKKRKQKSFTVDVIFQAVEQAVALLTSNKPRFTATGQEDSDTRIAAMYAAIMQFIWHVNAGTMKLKQIIKEYYVGSVGWSHTYWNPFAANGKGEIMIDAVDPKRVYVDNEATDFFWQDAPHMILETFLTSEMMQSTYNLTLGQLQGFETHVASLDTSSRVSEMDSGSANRVSGQSQMYRRLDRYSRVKETMLILEKDDERFQQILDPRQIIQRTKETMCIVATTVQATNYFVSPRNVSNVAKLLQQYGEVFHEVQDQQGQTQLMAGVEGQVEYPEGISPVPNSTTSLKLITMYDAIKKGVVKVRKAPLDRIKHVASIGRRELFTDILPTSHHVLLPLINNFDRTTAPIGDVRRVKREQEFINSIRQIVVTHAAVTTNFKIGYPEGRYNEAKLSEIYNDPTKRFIPYDAEMNSAGLQVLAPPPLPNHLYTLEDRARKNIEERLGIFALMQGSPTDAPSTYKGTVALDEYGQRRIKSKKDDVEDFLNQLGKIVVDFVQYYYTDTRVINIVTPNDKPMTYTLRNDSTLDNLHAGNEFRINDVMVGQYDILVVSGSMLPSNRFALLELYTDLYVKGLVDQETVLQKTEVANVEQVMERVGMIQKLQRALEEAQGQIKKLSGDLQTAEREVVHAKRDKDMTAFQRNLETEEVKATAARMIYENTLKMSRQAVARK